MEFDRILEAVRDKEVDAGLIIHEGQLTYSSMGLEKIVDLGVKGTLASGGTIPILNAASALAVTAACVLIFHEFLEEVMTP